MNQLLLSVVLDYSQQNEEHKQAGVNSFGNYFHTIQLVSNIIGEDLYGISTTLLDLVSKDIQTD